MVHKSVLLKEVIDGLDFKSGEVFLDGTINGGGHSEAVAKKFGKAVKIIGLDKDGTALARAEERLAGAGAEFILRRESFRNLGKVLADLNIKKADKILFDLGLSSNQLEESGRGFSFQKNEPLLMTFSDKASEEELTAKDIVNNWDEENIATVLWSYGEEKSSRAIAKKIVEAREKKPIETTFELVEIVRSALPGFRKFGRTNPATKVFQALRITVNDEIAALKEGLQKGFGALEAGGRMAVISFHSLEDRMVKNYFKEEAAAGRAKLIVKKPIAPAREEILENPRARSAKLRIIEKL